MLLWKLIILKGAKMKKKTLICVCILMIVLGILSGDSLFATKLGTLKDIAIPGYITVSNGQLYITDQKTDKSFLMNLTDLKIIKQLTQRGSGPIETQFMPMITVYSDYVFLYSNEKAIYFSRDGNYLKEFRIKKKGNWFMALGENFVLETTIAKNQERWTDISLYSYSNEMDLSALKNLYLSKNSQLTKSNGKFNLYLLKEYARYTVQDNKLFLGDSSRGLYLEVFNTKGDKINKIHLKQFEKQKVSEQFKNDYMKLVKSSPNYEAATKIYNLLLPEYFPGFYYFVVDKERVYFITYNRKGNNREVIVADWRNGKFIKKTEIPWIINESSYLLPIVDGKFYYPLENEETEEWELHVAEVK